MACGILVPRPGIEPMPPAAEARNLNHWLPGKPLHKHTFALKHLYLLLQEQYIFIHQCVELMWMKKKQQFCISDVIYENVSNS